MIYPVILCGGSGRRLWPLSRENFPKQFINLLERNSLFQKAAKLIDGINVNPIIISGEEYRFIVKQQLEEVGIDKSDVILEPEAMNTAPAILLAALHLIEKDNDATMVVMPSDHFISNKNLFNELLVKAKEQLDLYQIVCFGIKPTKPAAGYGYIKIAQGDDAVLGIEKFVEKPSSDLAKEFIKAKDYLWNSGIFLMRAREVIKMAKQYQPEMFRAVEISYKNAIVSQDFIRPEKSSWLTIKRNSFDYAFMEECDCAGCVRFDSDWVDLGDWSSIREFLQADQNGNVLHGDVLQRDSQNNLLWSENTGQVLASIGINDISVVVTGDAVLVAANERTQDLKLLVDNLAEKKYQQAIQSECVHRPWGNFKSIMSSTNFHVKLLNVNPNSQLSMQSHNFRSEHWVVVVGTAKVVRDGEVFFVKENESIYINVGSKHQLINNTCEVLKIIEVQTGTYFGEDDITRYHDKYDREIG